MILRRSFVTYRRCFSHLAYCDTALPIGDAVAPHVARVAPLGLLLGNNWPPLLTCVRGSTWRCEIVQAREPHEHDTIGAKSAICGPVSRAVYEQQADSEEGFSDRKLGDGWAECVWDSRAAELNYSSTHVGSQPWRTRGTKGKLSGFSVMKEKPELLPPNSGA